MIQRGSRAAAVMRRSNSSLPDSTQPGFQNSASIDTVGIPVIADSRRAKVDLPDPDDPITRTRCIGPVQDSIKVRSRPDQATARDDAGYRRFTKI
ncbi:hypothetical protein QIH80_21465 [Bradyrhizobium elkanii]|nr:hypothetical protein QIH80_21465 [Bradyrhizobium elkanii]